MFLWVSSEEEEDVNEKSIEEIEEEFNNKVRVYIIALLTFIVLYLCSYLLLIRYHKRKECDGGYGADEDAKVYRISLYICAFTLAVSFGAVLMLPMSMLGNEVVHLYPDSYWVQWLNGALIHTIWEWIFVLSNASLFLLLPFSYFFTESEGFSGQRRGLMPRVYETVTVLSLVALLGFGIAVLVLAFFDDDDQSFAIIKLVSEYYLQYLYSFFLCTWVLFTLTTCTPLGFTILFDAVGQVLVKPKIFENNDYQIVQQQLDEDAIKRKLKSPAYTSRMGAHERGKLQAELERVRSFRIKLERRKDASSLERNLGYPLAMMLILALTGLALFLVSIHILKLIFVGDHELHPSTVREEYEKDYRNLHNVNACQKPSDADAMHAKAYPARCGRQRSRARTKTDADGGEATIQSHLYSLGANSLSPFGVVGTVLEVLVILYLFLGSVLGLYNLPGFRRLRPALHDTSIIKLILNCLVLQLVGCSLPVLSRVLGITSFELQGNFGKLYWLGNFYIVFVFNVIFAFVTSLCLATKFTNKVRHELCKALHFQSLPLRRFLHERHRISGPLLTQLVKPSHHHHTPPDPAPPPPPPPVVDGELSGGESATKQTTTTTAALSLRAALSPLKLIGGVGASGNGVAVRQ